MREISFLIVERGRCVTGFALVRYLGCLSSCHKVYFHVLGDNVVDHVDIETLEIYREQMIM